MEYPDFICGWGEISHGFFISFIMAVIKNYNGKIHQMVWQVDKPFCVSHDLIYHGLPVCFKISPAPGEILKFQDRRHK